MFKISNRTAVKNRPLNACPKSQETFCGINWRS